MSRPPLRFGEHARRQMQARNVTRTEVGLVVDEPEDVYDSGDGRRVYRRGALAVVLRVDRYEVVTVLLNNRGRGGRWRDADVRCRDLLSGPS